MRDKGCLENSMFTLVHFPIIQSWSQWLRHLYSFKVHYMCEHRFSRLIKRLPGEVNRQNVAAGGVREEIPSRFAGLAGFLAML